MSSCCVYQLGFIIGRIRFMEQSKRIDCSSEVRENEYWSAKKAFGRRASCKSNEGCLLDVLSENSEASNRSVGKKAYSVRCCLLNRLRTGNQNITFESTMRSFRDSVKFWNVYLPGELRTSAKWLFRLEPIWWRFGFIEMFTFLFCALCFLFLSQGVFTYDCVRIFFRGFRMTVDSAVRRSDEVSWCWAFTVTCCSSRLISMVMN